MTAPDLAQATKVIELARSVIDACTTKIASESIDDNQVIAYELAHAAATVETGRSLLDHYAAKGDVEARITCAYIADSVGEMAAKLFGREELWGVTPGALDDARSFTAAYRAPEFLADLAFEPGPRHLDEDYEMVQDTFRRFAEDRIRPVADEVHRENLDIPEEVISGLAEMGGFGLSVPEEYGGFSQGGEGEYRAMVVATEELARGSLCVGGSLITRPEILTRALVAGGTEDQRQEWLPKLATTEVMGAVAVTEPDYGSDVAGVKVTATATEDGAGYLINGVKTWCTFGARANVLLLLARTDPDKTLGHKGLSLFLVPKPVAAGEGFELVQDTADGAPGGGRMEGRPIHTIGYRGMHSYEIALDNWWVSADNLIGKEGGLGKGFYYQMAGFENGRLQTAARAVGIMQAAYEEARQYAQDRVVFGHPIADYQLTKAKLGRMVVLTQAARQFGYHVATLMGAGQGQLEASMVKAYVCKAAEWVTREAMQIHGGFGYAEEYPVSRYFVDARVLSIFEGADETLCLKVIARRMVELAKQKD
jgi:(2S)-methylsuccinyl-CoA dehydrogenase